MSIINPFDVFHVTEISAAIQRLPNVYGRINELGLFPAQGVLSQTIAVEEYNGNLALIQTEQSQGPGSVGAVSKRKVRTFNVPRLIHNEHVEASEVNALRAFGTDSVESVSGLLAQKLATARAKHDITLEHLRMGALKGTVLDADGSTLIDLYSTYGITAKTVDFVLGTSTTDVTDKCRDVVDHIQDNLFGESMQRVHALVSPEFFRALIKHPKVEKYYLNYMSQQSARQLAGVPFNVFEFGGMTFEEYRGISTDPTTGAARRFIAADEGHAVPLGTVNTFRTFVAPADFNESINTIGQLYYAKVLPDRMDRGFDIHTQSNPLPLCLRPAVLVKVFSSN